MTLTPADVQAVRFRTALRGYSTTDVDAFLDRVAATLTRLTDELARLRAALAAPTESGTGAPDRSAPVTALPRPLPGETGEEAALRTLLLAQRTADQVVADAREEAERLLAAARDQAAALRAEGEARAADLDRELAVRRDEGLAGVEADRQALEAEVAQLAAFEREYRTRLKAHLQSQLQEIDGGGRGS
jgi:DivIVA domain-containing protein